MPYSLANLDLIELEPECLPMTICLSRPTSSGVNTSYVNGFLLPHPHEFLIHEQKYWTLQ